MPPHGYGASWTLAAHLENAAALLLAEELQSDETREGARTTSALPTGVLHASLKNCTTRHALGHAIVLVTCFHASQHYAGREFEIIVGRQTVGPEQPPRSRASLPFSTAYAPSSRLVYTASIGHVFEATRPDVRPTIPASRADVGSPRELGRCLG